MARTPPPPPTPSQPAGRTKRTSPATPAAPARAARAPKPATPVNEDRLLNDAERDMVAQTQPDVIRAHTEAELQALGKRLRSARDRARRIARQQTREMRGKAEPRATTPARENLGTEGKAEVLVEALKRVTAALRKLRAPTQAELTRKAAALKKAATATSRPDPGMTANAGMAAKTSRRRTVKADPREVGRVSQAVKVAQAKRDK